MPKWYRHQCYNFFTYFIYFFLSSQYISLFLSLVSISPLLPISFSLSFFYLSLSSSLRLQQPSPPHSATFTQRPRSDPIHINEAEIGWNFGLLSLIRRSLSLSLGGCGSISNGGWLFWLLVVGWFWLKVVGWSGCGCEIWDGLRLGCGCEICGYVVFIWVFFFFLFGGSNGWYWWLVLFCVGGRWLWAMAVDLRVWVVVDDCDDREEIIYYFNV